MKLSEQQVALKPLQALAAEASQLLIAGRFSELAAKFGYAVALGRSPLAAIQEDLGASLAQLRVAALDPGAEPVVQVEYFKPSDHLFALAECRLPTVGGAPLLLELAVSVVGKDFYATLEQISAAA